MCSIFVKKKKKSTPKVIKLILTVKLIFIILKLILKKGETFTGVHKSELVAWYLNEIESQIENEEQLNEQNVLIEKIIHRLINYVS